MTYIFRLHAHLIQFRLFIFSISLDQAWLCPSNSTRRWYCSSCSCGWQHGGSGDVSRWHYPMTAHSYSCRFPGPFYCRAASGQCCEVIYRRRFRCPAACWNIIQNKELFHSWNIFSSYLNNLLITSIYSCCWSTLAGSHLLAGSCQPQSHRWKV